MADLEDVERLAAGDHHLGVLTLARLDGSPHASVVSAGVIADPVDGSPGVGLVAIGGSVKLRLLRRDPRATMVFKAGYQWAAVSGPTRLIGPDDSTDLGIDVPSLIRAVYRAAGGDHRGLGRVRPGHGGGPALRRLHSGRPDLDEPRRLRRGLLGGPGALVGPGAGGGPGALVGPGAGVSSRHALGAPRLGRLGVRHPTCRPLRLLPGWTATNLGVLSVLGVAVSKR